MILDFHDEEIEKSIPRRLEVDLRSSRMITTAGFRRCGKSTYMTQIITNLLGSGVPMDRIVCINFVDERIRPHKTEVLDSIVETYYTLYPDNQDSTVHWFFDEIHLVPEWEYFIDRLNRRRENRVYITGSTSRLTSGEIASVLRGRSLVYELFPFSFKEILDRDGIDSTRLSTRTINRIRSAFDDYLMKGGMPETFGMDPKTRHNTLSSYYWTVLLRDLIERHNTQDATPIETAMKMITNSVGSPVSVNRLANSLRSLGYRVSNTMVSEYMHWLGEAYYLFQVPIFTRSEKKRRVNPQKIYIIDNGILNSVTIRFNDNLGVLLENLVFLHLRRLPGDIYYFKNKNGHEVDFVTESVDEGIRLWQVCWDISDERTLERELRAIGSAFEELGVGSATLITHNESRTIGLENGSVRVVPAWELLSEF